MAHADLCSHDDEDDVDDEHDNEVPDSASQGPTATQLYGMREDLSKFFGDLTYRWLIHALSRDRK